MSWFNKSSIRASSSASPLTTNSFSRDNKKNATSPAAPAPNSDPAVCLDVFRNHWRQVWNILQPVEPLPANKVSDEVETVLHNLEQMINLLISEDSDSGKPGRILNYLLEHEVLEKFGIWCNAVTDYAEKLFREQLKLYDTLISQCKQSLLIHQPIIQPLMNLLTASSSYLEQYKSCELQHAMITLLHQLCLSVSQDTLILDSFFKSSSDDSPGRFLIFSLLIPYVHSEENAGQQARDALLLVMALSARIDSVGHYIAHNSDFCPVLATGLSGLYSGLPRKLIHTSDDWHSLTDEDCMVLPELQMFLNSLHFCNAVAQVAHPSVRDKLIDFIYNGFLVLVMGPALHQNTRDEIIAATAYLELFIRKISEPMLLKAFLRFILSAKYDDVFVLDSLITRVNSSSALCVMSLSLFKTLIELNCEDVMFQLILKYLIPCSHVMVSQRRSVKELDLYSKSAKKFLCLRPACCTHLNDDVQESVPSTKSPYSGGTDQSILYASIFSNSYMDYLEDAHTRIRTCAQACRHWSAPYDGDNPPYNSTSGASSTFDVSRTYSDSVFEYSRTSVASSSKTCKTRVIPDASVVRDASSRFNDDTISSDVTGKDLSNASDDVESRDAKNMIDKLIRGSTNDYSNIGNVELSDSIDMNIRGDFCDSFSDKCDPDTVTRQRLTSSICELDTSRSDAFDISQCNNLDTFIQYLNTVDVSMSSVTSTAEDDYHVDIEDSMREIDSMISEFSSHQTRVDSSLESNFLTNADAPISRSNQMSLPPQQTAPSNVTRLSCDQTVKSGDDSSFINITSLGNMKPPMTTTTTTTAFDKSSNFLDATSFIVIDLPHVPNRVGETAAKINDDATKTNKTMAPTSQIESVVEVHHQPLDDTNISTEYDVPFHSKDESRILTMDNDQISSSNRTEILKPYQALSDESVSSFRNLSGRSASTLRPDMSKTESPCIGPFLCALFTKLELMMQNSLYVNLLLTDLISRIACYPQPLLRSFLLSHNLVFQPSVKSLVQVLGCVRQRVDSYLSTISTVEHLLTQARNTLVWHEHVYLSELEKVATATPSDGGTSNVAGVSPVKPKKSASIADLSSRVEKRRTSFAERLFRKSPNRQRTKHSTPPPRTKAAVLEATASGRGYHYRHTWGASHATNSTHESPTTINAIYCALILEEFMKELAALAQEHSVLSLDDGYHSN